MPIQSQNTREADRQRAIEIIRELAAQGHALSYIAKALDIRGVPTPSGRPGVSWDQSAVRRIVRRHGIGRRA